MSIEIAWDERGLAPAVVQDHRSHAILMLAWMNAQALAATLDTGIVHFYSRSRNCLWKKGESSGNTLELVEIRTDCDSDALIVLAKPAGPTCHTNRRSCFYREFGVADTGALALHQEDEGPNGAPSAIVDQLYAVLCERRDSESTDGKKSYTRSLLDKGFTAIEAKITEESGELLEVLATGEPNKVVHESADLLFHMMVGLCARGIPATDLWRELERRFGVGGHVEKAARSNK